MPASPSNLGAPGTRPPGVPIEDTGEHVRGMFDRIAPTYDRANHLLSLSMDRYWRWRTVRAIAHGLGAGTEAAPAAAGRRLVLDVCCGTGDLSLALRAGLGTRAAVVGADFSHGMLIRARAKDAGVQWIQADALRLPYADASFAAVTTAFGFRNLSDYRAGLAEFLRLLKPGGTLAILEVSRPTAPVLGPLYQFYFHRVLPRLGGWISGHPAAYRYLPDSVTRFPAPAELADWMQAADYERVQYTRFAGGIATLHLGRKKPDSQA